MSLSFPNRSFVKIFVQCVTNLFFCTSFRMLEDILDNSEEFSDCRDLRAKNDVYQINFIKLNSYDCRYTKKPFAT